METSGARSRSGQGSHRRQGGAVRSCVARRYGVVFTMYRYSYDNDNDERCMILDIGYEGVTAR